VKKGSIAGRGVLLDYYAYSQAVGIGYKLLGEGATHAISLSDLKACAAWEKVEIKPGDILLVRSGFWVGYHGLSRDEKKAFGEMKPETWVGVETNRDMAAWLWDSGIVAGAGDAPGWSVYRTTTRHRRLDCRARHCMRLCLEAGGCLSVRKVF